MIHLLVEYKCQKCGNIWPSNTDTQTKCARCGYDAQENIHRIDIIEDDEVAEPVDAEIV